MHQFANCLAGKSSLSKIRTLMKELNEFSHQLGPSRKTVIRRCDFWKDIVAFDSNNVYCADAASGYFFQC